MTGQERLHTAQELWGRSHQGGESARLELVRGEIVERTPTGGLHGLVTMELSRGIADYVREQGLGVVIAAEIGFILATNPDTVRAPDVALAQRKEHFRCIRTMHPRESRCSAVVHFVSSPGLNVFDASNAQEQCC